MEERIFRVAPDGDDAGPGSADRPFASLERARQAVRRLEEQSGGQLLQPVRVRLRGGTYLRREPLLLGPQDSGTRESPQARLTRLIPP